MALPFDRARDDDDMAPRALPDPPQNTDASKLSFPLQLVILIVTTILSVAGTNWATRGDIRSLSENQGRMSEDIKAINRNLPNQEALNMRLQAYDRSLQDLKDALAAEVQWRTKTREQMIKKGIIDP